MKVPVAIALTGALLALSAVVYSTTDIYTLRAWTGIGRPATLNPSAKWDGGRMARMRSLEAKAHYRLDDISPENIRMSNAEPISIHPDSSIFTDGHKAVRLVPDSSDVIYVVLRDEGQTQEEIEAQVEALEAEFNLVLVAPVIPDPTGLSFYFHVLDAHPNPSLVLDHAVTREVTVGAVAGAMHSLENLGEDAIQAVKAVHEGLFRKGSVRYYRQLPVRGTTLATNSNTFKTTPRKDREWVLTGRGDTALVKASLNVERAATEGKDGEGAFVSICDSGVDWEHPQLNGDRYRKDLAQNYHVVSTDAEYRNITPPWDDGSTRSGNGLGRWHGTPCAGHAIGDAGTCARGVAPAATWTGTRNDWDEYASTAPNSAFMNAGLGNNLAASFGIPEVQIYSNSWGLNGAYSGTPINVVDEPGLTTLNTQASNNVSAYFFAAGNAWDSGNDCAREDHHRSLNVISVGAASHDGQPAVYSNICSGVVVSAPTADHDPNSDGPAQTVDIGGGAAHLYDWSWGTDQRVSGYSGNNDGCGPFAGTSAATPLISGLAALMNAAAGRTLSVREHAIALGLSAVSQPADTRPVGELQFENGAGLTWGFVRGYGVPDARQAILAAKATPYTIFPPVSYPVDRGTTSLPPLAAGLQLTTIQPKQEDFPTDFVIDWVVVNFDLTTGDAANFDMFLMVDVDASGNTDVVAGVWNGFVFYDPLSQAYSSVKLGGFLKMEPWAHSWSYAVRTLGGNPATSSLRDVEIVFHGYQNFRFGTNVAMFMVVGAGVVGVGGAGGYYASSRSSKKSRRRAQEKMRARRSGGGSSGDISRTNGGDLLRSGSGGRPDTSGKNRRGKSRNSRSGGRKGSRGSGGRSRGSRGSRGSGGRSRGSRG